MNYTRPTDAKNGVQVSRFWGELPPTLALHQLKEREISARDEHQLKAALARAQNPDTSASQMFRKSVRGLQIMPVSKFGSTHPFAERPQGWWQFLVAANAVAQANAAGSFAFWSKFLFPCRLISFTSSSSNS